MSREWPPSTLYGGLSFVGSRPIALKGILGDNLEKTLIVWRRAFGLEQDCKQQVVPGETVDRGTC